MVILKKWPKYFGDFKNMTKYFGDIANLANRKMVLGQMTDEIMTGTKQFGDTANSPKKVQ